jgi:phage tail protein X
MAGDYVYETYLTQEGDTADLIAFERFGGSSGPTEAILDANPGLAARAAVLPAGLTIRIPVPVKKDRKQSTRLWS